MSIFPYVYLMVRSFDVTLDEGKTAFYAGLVTSSFALAECFASSPWGWLSDQVGRKPVLLAGMAGTGISMIMFGFAPSLPIALVSRALGGVLNGNIGVIQTTVAEVVQVKEHQPHAYSIMPAIWCFGSIIGSTLGGALADPVNNFPLAFPRGTIFEKFPYLLPNLVCGAVVLFSLAIGTLFLKETNEKMKDRRDLGLEIGRWILSLFNSNKPEDITYYEFAAASSDETATLLQNNIQPPGYTSKQKSSKPSMCKSMKYDEAIPANGALKTFNTQVKLHIYAYGILA
ncbi:MAG: hypothetical protein M1828_002696 [Chrysothrix sp. TS-e1954]|nr:MAG: hypothetical protein M1828_002696 [Chrysothrix sp. TS-e1954]